MKRTEIKHLLASPKIGEQVLVKGWVRHFRSNRFIIINDGSTINNIQAVVDIDKFSQDKLDGINTGASVAVQGVINESQGAGQAVEIQVESLTVIGKAPADEYPLQPKKHSLEFLREIAHLRPRTNTFAAILRVRHALQFAA